MIGASREACLWHAPPLFGSQWMMRYPFGMLSGRCCDAYFDQLAKSIDPLTLTFPRIGGPGDAPVLWLEVEETETLRQLHTRINQELAERFPETQAPFDGPAYHFHLTIALWHIVVIDVSIRDCSRSEHQRAAWEEVEG